VANSTFSKFTVLPSQFGGLSGIGEYMIDMYLFLNGKNYLNKAYEIAKSVLLYPTSPLFEPPIFINTYYLIIYTIPSPLVVDEDNFKIF
jgi:hypothetical protein